MWTMWSQVTKHFTRGAASISGRGKMHEVCRERARNRTKYMWLDSQYAVKWIGSNRKFTTFVENRLNEIRKDRDIVFHYIASSEKPANFPSRSLDTEELRDIHLWWTRLDTFTL